MEVCDPGLEGAAEERLVESDLPALGLLGLEIGIAGDSKAAELVEEARRLDALPPGPVQSRVSVTGTTAASVTRGENASPNAVLSS